MESFTQRSFQDVASCLPQTGSIVTDYNANLTCMCLFYPTEKHLVLLRDGRTLIGYLRSIDQFANLVFHQTVERIHVGKKFGDIPRGIFIVRGENVVLLGEIDVEKPCDTVLQQVSIEEILEEQRLQQQTKQETEKVKMQVLKDRGLSIPKADNLDEY
uniref:U6 snRNA-associated Sm-like protein LSm1 n=1 Tax=Acanthochromis polyacanthus TaxID=80966 RepID=A0A3Q1EXT9_9TELE